MRARFVRQVPVLRNLTLLPHSPPVRMYRLLPEIPQAVARGEISSCAATVVARCSLCESVKPATELAGLRVARHGCAVRACNWGSCLPFIP